MSCSKLNRKRQMCYKLIFMGLAWAGFIFLLEYLATKDGDALDYTQSPGAEQLVWIIKAGGLAVALVGAVMLGRTYRHGEK